MTSTFGRAASSFWSRSKAMPVKYPFAFGVIISGFKTSFSDLLVQKVVEQRKEVDWKRNAAFATFGFVYLGGVQYSLYVPIFGRLFPHAAKFAKLPLVDKLKDTKGMIQLVAQVFLDQCVHHPLMYFPAFYITREMVMSNPSNPPDIKKVLTDYFTVNIREDLIALWKIWVPATCLNFAFMPMHMRIPFTAGVSLLWTCVLSAMRGGDVVHADDLAMGAVTGSTLSLMREGLDENFNNTPVEMDHNMAHFNVSAVGKDRAGIVAGLTQHIARDGGNITHSKMVRLGEEFIIQMHVAIPPEKKHVIQSNLQRRKTISHEMDIHVTELRRREYDAHPTKKAVMGMVINCIGEDRPGMLAAISERIANNGMSFEELSTELRWNQKTKKREFFVKAMVSSTSIQAGDTEVFDELVKEISKLKEELDLSTLDIRVHMRQEIE